MLADMITFGLKALKILQALYCSNTFFKKKIFGSFFLVGGVLFSHFNS